MRNLLFITLTITNLTSFSQNKVIFKTFYKPNKVYTSATTTYSESVMDFSGDQKILDVLAASGIKNPMTFAGTANKSTTITTGALTVDLSFPARIVFGEVTDVQKLNDQDIKKDNPLSGLVMEGFYTKDNLLRIDTIISDKIDSLTKVTIKSTIENAQQQIKFPDNPIGIGESFERQLPMQIPVAGFKLVKVLINIKYKLVEINGDKAKFDLVQTASLEMTTDQGDVSAAGKGFGTSEFDMTHNMVTKFDSDMTLTMKLIINEIQITAKINSKSNTLVTVN